MLQLKRSGAALALVLSAIALGVASALTQGWEQGIAESLSASCMFTLILTESPRLREFVIRRNFRKFFGAAAVRNRMSLVYPHFTLSAEATTILETSGFNLQQMYQKTRTSRRLYKVDIPHAVAINDIQALMEMSWCFSEVLGRPPKIESDSEATEHPARCFLSFGFSSNECTHMFLESCTNPPFSVVTEEHSTKRYREHIDVVMKDGSVKSFKSTDDREIGIIAKFTPSFDTDKDVIWFLVGGLGPNGTVGAARYLARAWRSIFEQVGSKEFLCIVEVPADIPGLPRRLLLRETAIIEGVLAGETEKPSFAA